MRFQVEAETGIALVWVAGLAFFHRGSADCREATDLTQFGFYKIPGKPMSTSPQF